MTDEQLSSNINTLLDNHIIERNKEKGEMIMSVTNEVIAILKEVKPTKNLENEKSIVEGGLLDSFELMTLISSLCDKFGIEIDVDDMTPENFNSVEAIAAMVERLK